MHIALTFHGELHSGTTLQDEPYHVVWYRKKKMLAFLCSVRVCEALKITRNWARPVAPTASVSKSISCLDWYYEKTYSGCRVFLLFVLVCRHLSFLLCAKCRAVGIVWVHDQRKSQLGRLSGAKVENGLKRNQTSASPCLTFNDTPYVILYTYKYIKVRLMSMYISDGCVSFCNGWTRTTGRACRV